MINGNTDKYAATSSIITDGALMFYRDGKEYVAHADNINFSRIKAAINDREFDKAIRLFNPREVLKELGNENLVISDESVTWKGDVVHAELEKRLIKAISDGHENVQPFINLMDNIYANPSKNSREQMYGFIVNHGMPILDDGMFVGYKGVSEDYKDKHSGEWTNTVGITNKMDRRDCDDNPDHHCSQGFHVGSKEYADGWAGSSGHLMAVAWNPKDAVSVPNGHGCHKLRVSKYTVIAEIFERSKFFEGSFYRMDDDEGFVEMDKDDVLEQQYSDNYYKVRNKEEESLEYDEDITAEYCVDLQKDYPISRSNWMMILNDICHFDLTTGLDILDEVIKVHVPQEIVDTFDNAESLSRSQDLISIGH